MDDRYLAPALKVFVDGTELTPDVALHLARAVVTLQRDSLDAFALELVNPYPDLPWTHGEFKEVFAPGKPVVVQMGYVDALQPLIDGEVTRIAASFGEEGTSVLRVSGTTGLHRLQAATRTRTFLEATDADIVSRVAQEAGLTAAVQGATDVTHPYVAQVNQTDLAFLRTRARRIGYEIFGEGSKLHFVPLRNAAASSLTLVWGRTATAFTPPAELVPLRSFTPALDAQGLVTGVTVRWYDPATMEVIEASATAPTTVMGAEAAPDAVTAAFGAAPLLVADRPVATVAEAMALAKALLEERSLGFVTATGTAVGLPDLRAGAVVKVDGVGDRFVGEYLISRATHDFSVDGYVTSFHAQRNAAG